MDYKNKYVMVKLNALCAGMEEPAMRVFLVTGGFGAAGAALSLNGGKCFGHFVYDGIDDYIYRRSIERLATDEEVAAALAKRSQDHG